MFGWLISFSKFYFCFHMVWVVLDPISNDYWMFCCLWQEPWLMCLIGFHFALLLLTIFSRKNINFQMCLFLLACRSITSMVSAAIIRFYSLGSSSWVMIDIMSNYLEKCFTFSSHVDYKIAVKEKKSLNIEDAWYWLVEGCSARNLRFH